MAFVAATVLLTVIVFFLEPLIGMRGQAALGALALVCMTAACSSNVRAIDWRVVAWGAGLQLMLAVLVLKLEIGGVRPGYLLFSAIGRGAAQFLEFTNAGSQFGLEDLLIHR